MEELYTETPELISSIDTEESKLLLEFTMLEVEKESITLKIGELGCYLSAPADNTLYVAALAFPCPVDPSGAQAKYEEGYLKVAIPLREEIRNFITIPVA